MTMTATETLSFTTLRAVFTEIVEAASRIALPRGNAVLQCVRLEVADGKLIVDATRLDSSLRIQTARIAESSPGAICVNAPDLLRVLKSFNCESLTVEKGDGKVIVTGDGSRLSIPSVDPKDFPPMPEAVSESFRIDAAKLASAITAVAPAASEISTRYAFAGVLIHRKGTNVDIVATDGSRMHWAECAVAKGDDATGIVPIPAARALLAIPAEGELCVGISENRIDVSTDDVRFSATLIEGSFPPYADIVPRSTEYTATVSLESMLFAINQARIATSSIPEFTGARFEFGNKGLKISCHNGGGTEADINLPLKCDGGMIIGLKPHQLADGLRAIDADEVTIWLTAPNRPFVMFGGNVRCVAMPVNLQR